MIKIKNLLKHIKSRIDYIQNKNEYSEKEKQVRKSELQHFLNWAGTQHDKADNFLFDFDTPCIEDEDKLEMCAKIAAAIMKKIADSQNSNHIVFELNGIVRIETCEDFGDIKIDWTRA